MLLRKILILSPLVLAACNGGATDGEPAASTSLDEDLAHFSELYDGEFTNFGVSSDEGAIRHYVYRRVDLPAFGDDVIYVQQYYGAGDGDPNSTVYRQRIYSSYADPERGEIVTKIYSFKDGAEEQYLNAQNDPAMLAGLTPDDMDTLPDGCEIFWAREGDSIMGYQKEGVCVMQVPGSDVTMLLSDELELTSSRYVTQTRGKTEDGDLLFGDDEPLVMHRANIYDCSVSVGRENGRARMHDLGGVASLDAFGGSGRAQLSRTDASDLGSSTTLKLFDGDGNEVAKASGSEGAVELAEGGTTIACKPSNNPWENPKTPE